MYCYSFSQKKVCCPDKKVCWPLEKHYCYPPVSAVKNNSNGGTKDDGTCCTISDMTDNPAYGTTRRLMANLSQNTSANLWVSKDEESIVMHMNPTYAPVAEIMPNMDRGY